MSKTTTAFFYGTLMHPEILKRVIGNDGTHLEICAAVLMEYTRHKVKWVDYPGIVPFTRSHDGLLKGREVSQEDRCVRGTLVAGLTKRDIRLLDYFEGPEYTRDPVKVQPLGSFASLSTHSAEFRRLFPVHPPPLPDVSELASVIESETYVYIDLTRLDSSPWDFGQFVECNAWKWYGAGSEGNEDIAEVDRRRARGEQMGGQLE